MTYNVSVAKSIISVARLTLAPVALSACAASAQASLPRLPPQNGLSAEQIEGVLQRLARAQQAARGSGSLPFRLTCTDEKSTDACRDSGRVALAELPLAAIGNIMPIYNTTCARSVFEYPADRCPTGVTQAARKIDAFQIRLYQAAGDGYTWTVGLAPEDGVEEIQLERGFVHVERI